MAKEQVLYLKTTGLNPSKPAQELGWTPDGTCELAECNNTLIDPNGKLRRGLGLSQIASTANVHTLVDVGRKFVGVGTMLYEIVAGALVLRKSNCSGNKVSIVQYGENAYCCDGVNLFYIKADGTVATWAFTAKSGAKTTRPYASPVVHAKSCVWFGRVFILYSGIAFHSEPIGPNMFDYSRNVVWDSNPITEFASVKGAMVFATTKNVFVLYGDNFESTQRLVVSTKPAFANTVVSGLIDGVPAVCFTTTAGMFAVFGNGQVKRITEEKIPNGLLTDSFIGASIVKNRYGIYSSDENWICNLTTGSLEEHDGQYLLVSGSLGYKSPIVGELEELKYDAEVSTVAFPSTSFGVSYVKGIRYLNVSGYIEKEATWTITDNAGNQDVRVTDGASFPKLRKIPVSSDVFGQYISVKFETAGDFKLDSVHVVPVIKATRG